MTDDRVDIRYVLERLDHLDDLETVEAFVVLEEFKHELRLALKANLEANEKSRKNQIH
tara:strand:- start:2687 stop:2860 length:174 start_codon:yes stop_codon:yes gene_type:complete